MTKIQVYRDGRGIWSFEASMGAWKFVGELADGYRVSDGRGGRLCIMGAPGELPMKAGEAVRRGVLRIPMSWPSYGRPEA